MGAPGDWPGRRPEVVFVGRVNSGKSAVINALLSADVKVAQVSKTRALTKWLDFFEINSQRAGLPHFMLVDTPGLGHAEIKAKLTRDWPDMIYSYFRKREALKHVFHLVDARNKKLLPADKQIIHLLASAQRPRVRYTIVITKIDVVSRKLANATAEKIREELGQYVDVDIMFASARTLRGIDQLWSKIWMSVTETPRGKRHKELGAKELLRLRQNGIPQEQNSVADVLGLHGMDSRQPDLQDFNGSDWEEDESVEEHDDTEFEPTPEGRKTGHDEIPYFNDSWDQDALAEDDDSLEMMEELDLTEEDFEEAWQAGEEDIDEEEQLAR